MNKDQTLGQLRAFLLALGTALATFGLHDGQQWLPAIGIVLAGVSVTWGVLHHKDPTNPGKVSWSLFRKFVNAACTAAATYGFMSQDKAGTVGALLVTLGPLLAARWSWIDNSTDDSPPPPVDPRNYLWLLLACAAFLLPSCADFPIALRVESPWGNATTDAKGRITIAPRPIIIPQK